MIPSLSDNPFAVLSAVAAPAILTNACSVLALGTANRIARVVDRSRVVMEMEAKEPPGPARDSQARQLAHLRLRAKLLLRSLRLFYTALAMFATTALTAIVGSAFVAFEVHLAFHIAAVIGFIVGAGGVFAIVTGCALMVTETRLAIRSLAEEHAGMARAGTN